jgi:hypothetical protein
MKIALCFIISYEHILNKEDIWREWIEPNKDIINVYFYYKDITKIKSKWILEHAIPSNYIYETSYYHVIPAYTSILSFAVNHDKNNQWFCMLTDSCCPIISPKRFKYLFYENYNKTIMAWKKAWWNVNLHKRANLALLPQEFRLGNDPWFVLKREHILCINKYMNTKKEIVKTICDGGLANESLFVIILYASKQLNKTQLISSTTHATDWSRMTTSTSPHLFKNADKTDIIFIEKFLKENKYTMFIRKVSPEFPDTILKKYIYDYSKDVYEDNDPCVFNIFSVLYYSISLSLFLFFIFKYIFYLFI